MIHVYSYDNTDCSGTSSSRVIQYTIRVQCGLIALQNGYLFFYDSIPFGNIKPPLVLTKTMQAGGPLH